MQKSLLLYFLLITCFLFITVFSLRAQEPDFTLKKTFDLPEFRPTTIALDKDKNLYLLEGKVINKMNPDGFVIQAFPVDPYGFETGLDLAVDRDGNIYITSSHDQSVQKFNPAGKRLMAFGAPGTGPGQFGALHGLALDDAGNIYVADKSNNRVQKFNAQGEFLSGFRLTTTAKILDIKVGKSSIVYSLTEDYRIFKNGPDGQLAGAFKISIPDLPSSGGGNSFDLDQEENIYVADENGKEIHQLSSSGQYFRSFGYNGAGRFGTGIGSFVGPIRLAVSEKGEVYSTDPGYQTIQVFSPDGSEYRKWSHNQAYRAISQDNQGNYFLLVNHSGYAYIQKYNAYGILVTQFGSAGPPAEQLVGATTITIDDFGNVYCLGYWQDGTFIKKFSNDGRYLTQLEDFGSDFERNRQTLTDIATDTKGNIYVTDFTGGYIRKISSTGKFIAKIGSPERGVNRIYQPMALTLDRSGNFYLVDEYGSQIRKFNPAGQVLPEFNTVFIPGRYGTGTTASVAVDFQGFVYAYTNKNLIQQNPLIQVYNASGRPVAAWSADLGSEVSINRNGKKLMVAESSVVREYLSGDAGRESLISGRVFQDENVNCLLDGNEKPLAGVVIVAEPGPYYGVSDASGHYSIAVDSGRYTIRTLLPQDPGRTITPTCVASSGQPVVLRGHGQAVKGPDFGNQVSIAPVLSVEVTSTRRRRCFRNVTAVSYANTGFATAPGAKVTVQLPEYVSFISANIPHTKDAKGNFLFAVGDLQPNQRGTITIIDSVSCADPSIRNLTVCTQAWITPVNTYPAPATWNRADVSVTGSTLADGQARFVIRNHGPGDMTDSLQFRVYQDMDLALTAKYKLAAQDSLVLRFMPTGRAVRVEADQPQGHPVKAAAAAKMEKKLRVAAALPALAMMAYPPDDPEPEISQDCQPIIDSFDPNDKQVVPVGLTSAHYTPTNTPLRYTVRFQNTGTDYAYRVVVVDTLSSDLDLATLQVSTFSQDYRLAITGKIKPVLTFTFDHLMLPDSARDQAGSNGYIQFSIKPKTNLPEKTKIENYADIFFDFNEPVRTNTTVNRIYDVPLAVNTQKQLLARDVITSPALDSFSPRQSRAGEMVRLKGRNFAATADGNQVTFNRVTATVVSATDSALTVLVPANAFSGKIQVVTPDGSAQSSSDYVIFQPPTLTAVDPVEAKPGTVVNLTGNYFSPLPGQDTITFNGVAAKVLEASETSLKVEVPAGATLGKILVRTLGGQAEIAQPFMVWYPPVITDHSPGKGKAGAAISLNGNNFAENADRNKVQFGITVAEVLAASATRLLVKVPGAAPSGQIRVQTPGGTAFTPQDFTFIPAPEISAFTPARGNAGATITLTGHHFNANGQADTIYFNALPAKVMKATETLLEVQAPKGVESGTITVAGAGGKALVAGFEVPDLSPEEAIDIYPNPTQAAITINWFKAYFTLERLLIYNAIGKLVAEIDPAAASQDELQIPLSRFGAGLYLIHIQTSDGPVVKRVTVL